MYSTKKTTATKKQNAHKITCFDQYGREDLLVHWQFSLVQNSIPGIIHTITVTS